MFHLECLVILLFLCTLTCTVRGFHASSRFLIRSSSARNPRLFMSDFGNDFDASKKPAGSVKTPVAPEMAPFETDETDTETTEVVPPEPELSNAMKDKLRAEINAQGGNPNVASANPILIIAGIVAVLVALGGKDILF